MRRMRPCPIDECELDALFACLEGRRAVGLAVSGGADSVALMHLAARWRALDPEARPALAVLSVDHGLRAESGEEAARVRGWARALGLPAKVLRWQGAKPATGVQTAARAARYDLLATYARRHGLCAVATAHHLDDQAETVLMRLARGSGVDGLAAMSVKSHWAGVVVLRPLLDVPKARLVATLRAAGADWIEDPSNDSARFERTRTRRALAALARYGVAAEALALTARRMRRARGALDAAADGLVAEHVALCEAGYAQLPAPALLAAPAEVALRAVARLLAGIGGQKGPPRLQRLEALLERLRAGGTQGRTLAGCRIRLRDGTLTVLREPGRRGLPELRLAPGETALWDRRFEVRASPGVARPVTVRALTGAGLRTLKARLDAPVALPEGAAAGLVSFWRDGELVAVPPLGYAGGAEPRDVRGAAYSAIFLAGRALQANAVCRGGTRI